MKAWEKQYAKLLNNKWQTKSDQESEPDEDELYLLDEKRSALNRSGFHQCPHCEVVGEFNHRDLHCEECGWCAEEDHQWNDDQCAA